MHDINKFHLNLRKSLYVSQILINKTNIGEIMFPNFFNQKFKSISCLCIDMKQQNITQNNLI